MKLKFILLPVLAVMLLQAPASTSTQGLYYREEERGTLGYDHIMRREIFVSVITSALPKTDIRCLSAGYRPTDPETMRDLIKDWSLKHPSWEIILNLSYQGHGHTSALVALLEHIGNNSVRFCKLKILAEHYIGFPPSLQACLDETRNALEKTLRARNVLETFLKERKSLEEAFAKLGKTSTKDASPSQ